MKTSVTGRFVTPVFSFYSLKDLNDDFADLAGGGRKITSFGYVTARSRQALTT